MEERGSILYKILQSKHGLKKTYLMFILLLQAPLHSGVIYICVTHDMAEQLYIKKEGLQVTRRMVGVMKDLKRAFRATG